METIQTGKRRILIIDDEPAVLSLLRRILSNEDTEIFAARSGARALDIARRTLVDLVLLDIKLPDVSGLDVLKRILAIDAFVPVIMITSHGSAETVRTAMESGAFDYLTKPFNNQEVRRIAREAVLTGARSRQSGTSEVQSGIA